MSTNTKTGETKKGPGCWLFVYRVAVFGMGVGAVGGGDLIGGLYPEGTGAGAGHGILLAGGVFIEGLTLGSAGNVFAVLLENLGNDDLGYAGVGFNTGVHGSLAARNRQVIGKGGFGNIPGESSHRKRKAKGNRQDKGQPFLHGLSHTIFLLIFD